MEAKMNSRYTQDKAGSAEILRLILQRMAGHPAALNPATYAVWYEFLTGINPALAEAMNKLLDEKGEVTTAITQKFFDRYISEVDPQAQDAFRLNMQKLLDNMSKFADTTESETDRFSAGLQKHGEVLSKGVDAPSLKSLVGEIMQDTQIMRSSVESLQDKLQESKGEVEKLQLELHNARSEALVDPLTGVYNRRGFESQMKKLVADPDLKGKRACFMMLDIDFFKKVNDTYGHLFGDKVICGIATALKARVKGQDTVARMGGEEFAVILPDTPLQGAFAVAEQIRQSIEKSKIRRSEKQDIIEGITISIGIADCDISGDWTGALNRADEALYASKTQGRNRTTLYDSIKVVAQ